MLVEPLLDMGSDRSVTLDVAAPTTLAEAMQFVAGLADLSAQRRRVLVSDLNCAARLTKLPPTNVSLSPASLRSHLLGLSGTGMGVSVSRWRNILSSMRYVLRRAGIIDAENTTRSPEWQEVLALIDPIGAAPEEEAVMKKLAPKGASLFAFAAFCSSADIGPSKVSLQTFSDFQDYLAARTLTTNPRKVVGAARSAWNRCHRHIGMWPGKPVAAIPDSRVASPDVV